MSDLYAHDLALPGDWDHRHDNLLTLGRHLVLSAGAIRAAGGLAFGDPNMRDLPLPAEITPSTPRPPIAHGPDAGLAAEPGEDWLAYGARAFGTEEGGALLSWLQSPMWRKTDPSPEGAGLRISYLLDYGLPHDHVEIAMGQAYSDYDTNGFMWEKLDLLPPEYAPDERPQRRLKRPEWVGAVELEQRRAAVKQDFLLPPDEPPFFAGLRTADRTALAARIGPLPAIYHDFLLLSGRRTSLDDPRAYADRLDEMREVARQRIVSSEREDDDPVPPDALFIGMEDGRHPEFILGGKRKDSQVFRFDADTGRVTRIGFSIFDWIGRFMATAAPPPAPPAEPQAVAGQGGLLRFIRRLFG